MKTPLKTVAFGGVARELFMDKVAVSLGPFESLMG
jgi:hypothetical protein